MKKGLNKLESALRSGARRVLQVPEEQGAGEYSQGCLWHLSGVSQQHLCSFPLSSPGQQLGAVVLAVLGDWAVQHLQ